MKKLIAIAAAAALAVPAAAQAKGPDEAKIAGPGVGRTIVLNISGYGESGKGTMGRLTTEGGFFPQVFGDWPDPRLPKKPANLGPRYRVDYHMPGPTAPVTLHQDLYPYASSGLVTYMRTGQRFWSGQQTKGGWMRVQDCPRLHPPATPTLHSEPSAGSRGAWPRPRSPQARSWRRAGASRLRAPHVKNRQRLLEGPMPTLSALQKPRESSRVSVQLAGTQWKVAASRAMGARCAPVMACRIPAPVQ